MATSRASRRVGKKGDRVLREDVRIEDAGMVEVRGVGWPSVGALRRVAIGIVCTE